MLYFEPNFLDEALVLLDRFGSDARVLAGGTRLGFQLRSRPASDVRALVNVKRIDELHDIESDSEVLRIGALATAAELQTHALVRRHAPLLAEAAASLGARQLRTVATIGGNICSGDPASDLTAALLAYDARCEVGTLHEGPVIVGLERLTIKTAPVLTSSELLVAIEIPICPHRYAYQRMTTRRDFEMALVAVAAVCVFKGDVIKDARIALAGAGPTPMRALAAEAVLSGQPLTARTSDEAARVAAESDAQPISDHRASASYRRHLVETLTRRALLTMVLAPADGQL